MSMFRDVVAQALDDGYAAAAAGRAAAGQTRRRTLRRRALLLGGTIALGLLFTVAAMQVERSESAIEEERAELVDRIRAQTNEVDTLTERADELSEEVSQLQGRQLARTAQGQSLQEDISALELLAGAARVRGPGVRIVVDDAPSDTVDSSDPTGGRVLDVDLQHLVNGLWWAGAEAISIDGQRLTALTAIRGADQAITVDYRPLARPYVVEAIGDPESLQARFAESTGGSWFASLSQNQKIRFEISAVDDVQMPGNSGVQTRYAQAGGTS